MMIRNTEEIKDLRTEKMNCMISSNLSERSNDYIILKDGKNISTISFPFFKAKKIEQKTKLDNVVSYYSKQDIDRFSPDRINSRLFWSYMLKNFPLASITSKHVKDVEEANFSTLGMSNELNALKTLIDKIYADDIEPKILEIGGGNGNVYHYLSDNDILNVDKNYYHVDLSKNFKHKNFYQTNGYGLPSSLLNKRVKFDIIYSINVFQHLSYRQKLAYYYSVFEKLKTGGNFIFSLFIKNDNNKDKPFWGNKDLKENCYCKFFNQLTPIDEEEALFKILFEVGFKNINIIGFYNGYYVLKLMK